MVSMQWTANSAITAQTSDNAMLELIMSWVTYHAAGAYPAAGLV